MVRAIWKVTYVYRMLGAARGLRNGSVFVLAQDLPHAVAFAESYEEYQGRRLAEVTSVVKTGGVWDGRSDAA